VGEIRWKNGASRVQIRGRSANPGGTRETDRKINLQASGENAVEPWLVEKIGNIHGEGHGKDSGGGARASVCSIDSRRRG